MNFVVATGKPPIKIGSCMSLHHQADTHTTEGSSSCVNVMVNSNIFGHWHTTTYCLHQQELTLHYSKCIIDDRTVSLSNLSLLYKFIIATDIIMNMFQYHRQVYMTVMSALCQVVSQDDWCPFVVSMDYHVVMLNLWQHPWLLIWIIWIISSYAHFGTPTCRQATIRMYLMAER